MSFVSSIIVVKDVVHSRHLYEDILGLRVSADFGIYNVGFEGGLSLYQKALFQELTGGLDVVTHSNSFVLYFEVDDLEGLEREVARHGFAFVHHIREQPWKQRTFRVYDDDGHMLEIAEKMDAVSRRLLAEGHTVDEIARLTGLPQDQVVHQVAETPGPAGYRAELEERTHMHVRPGTPADYPSMVAIYNALYPNRPTTVEAWLQADRERAPGCKQRAWLALLAGQADEDAQLVAGYGGYEQSPFDYHPGKFQVFVNVLPAHRRQGIGAALYDRVLAGLRPFEPSTLRADCYANLPEGIRFAEQRGFQEVFRETPLRLEVAAFDPAPYAGLEDRLRAQGVQIKTVRELQDDPDRNRKLYDLYWETFRDVPQEGVVTPMAFDEWVQWALHYPGLSHDGYWVGVCGQEYVGLSEFARKPDTDIMQAGLVGVKRAFRRKGVALAIQVRAIAFARQIGCSCIETSTSITNIPMRNLYARLGYVRQPDWLQMELRITSGIW